MEGSVGTLLLIGSKQAFVLINLPFFSFLKFLFNNILYTFAKHNLTVAEVQMRPRGSIYHEETLAHYPCHWEQ